jgi:F-type H+-transporting ATPase subunit delta
MSAAHETPKHDTVMDVAEEQIAAVYAQAFMAIANKAGKTGELVEELHSLVVDVVDKFPQLGEALRSAFVSHEEKIQLFDRVLSGRTSIELLNFLKVLSKRGRLAILRPIDRQVRQRYAKQLGQIDVEVRVARSIDDNLLAAIKNKLATSLGGQPILHVVVDPSLIAGIVIKVGDRVYDASVKTQFEVARRAIIDHARDLIETQPQRFFQTAT